MARQWCIGLDLSLASSSGSRIGIAAAPLDWDCETKRVQFSLVKYPHAPTDDDSRGLRLRHLAQQTEFEARMLVPAGDRIVCWAVESLPTHQAFNLVPLAELHGAIRYLMSEHGAHVLTCPQRTGRALLLGKCPTKGIKEFTRQVVQSISGFASITPDQGDAFVVLNWALSELGAPCLSSKSSTGSECNAVRPAVSGENRSKGSSAQCAKPECTTKTDPNQVKKQPRNRKPRS